ncbi:hypothetical protein, partial [Nostoc flagelliforme]|uniref:hypothetical protein n=1 Tax=Nostoc flagelliforme TaxID=1306274 RepID=UPI001A7E2031
FCKFSFCNLLKYPLAGIAVSPRVYLIYILCKLDVEQLMIDVFPVPPLLRGASAVLGVSPMSDWRGLGGIELYAAS